MSQCLYSCDSPEISIEGYHVEVDDAVAALDEDEPLSTDERTFAEIRGYRQALGYFLSMAGDDDFVLDTSAIRSMHFMMLSHDLAKSPGRYRQGPVYVYDEGEATVVYEGPDALLIPGLMEELVTDLALDNDADLLVRAAMAHLNLVMVHPFCDGFAKPTPSGQLWTSWQLSTPCRSGSRTCSSTPCWVIDCGAARTSSEPRSKSAQLLGTSSGLSTWGC